MATIVIPSFTLPNNHNYSGQLRFRVYYTGCVGPQFIAADTTAVMCGTPNGDWFVEVTPTILGAVMTMPALTLYTTDDSNTATVEAHGVFVVNGAQKSWLFQNWIITSTLGSTPAFAQLWIYNQQVTPSASLNPAYLTAPQVAALIAPVTNRVAELETLAPYTFTFDATSLWDSGYWISRTGYHQHSPMARAVFETDATSVDIAVFFNGSPDPQAKIVVKVNGVAYAYPFVALAGANTVTQALPAGRKLVEIVGGVQAVPASNPLGIFLIGCTFNARTLQLAPTANDSLLVYGDSNAQGGGGAPNVSVAWPGLYRNLTSRSVIIEALSGRSLNDDTSSAPIQAAFVARITAIAPSEMWIALGTNDYNAAIWSAASFGTAYGSLLDALHVALPNLRIYCQSPIIKGNLSVLMLEPANSFGSILHDYRDQVRTVVEARGSYCTYVEGLTIVSLADMRADGLHVSDSGNARYARFVDDYLSGRLVLSYDPLASQEDVVWQNAVNVTVTTNSEEKTGGVNGSFDAGASSTQAIISGNGWTRYTCTETNKTRVGGLSKGDGGQGFTEIDFALAPQGAGNGIGIFENGSSLGSGALLYAAGDQLQVRVVFPVVLYERIRAGVVKVIQMSPTLLTSSSYPLRLDTSIQNTNGTINNAKIYGSLQ